MAIAVGATSKGRSASASSVVTTGVTTQASSSIIVVGAIWDTVNFSSIADSKSNTYTLIDTELSWGFGSAKSRLYYCENATGGASHTVTVTLSGAGPLDVFLVEITGALTSGSLDVHNSNADFTSPFTSPSITTTQAAELLISLLAGNSGNNPATHAESTGFTIQSGAEETNGASFYTGCLATRIVSGTGTYNSSFTESGASNTGVHIASFKEAAAANNPLSYSGGFLKRRVYRPRPYCPGNTR